MTDSMYMQDNIAAGINAAVQGQRWELIVANTAIPQTGLNGIFIATSGTCIALDAKETPTELPLTGLDGYHPIRPTKLKTGLTSVVYALYGA